MHRFEHRRPARMQISACRHSQPALQGRCHVRNDVPEHVVGHDYVKLFEGDRINETAKLGTFCGNLTSNIAKIVTKTNAMTVQFVTDWSINHSGFKAAIDFTIRKGEEIGLKVVANDI